MRLTDRTGEDWALTAMRLVMPLSDLMAWPGMDSLLRLLAAPDSRFDKAAVTESLEALRREECQPLADIRRTLGEEEGKEVGTDEDLLWLCLLLRRHPPQRVARVLNELGRVSQRRLIEAALESLEEDDDRERARDMLLWQLRSDPETLSELPKPPGLRRSRRRPPDTRQVRQSLLNTLEEEP